MNRIRVLVVDDSKFARLAIRKALSSCEDMEVVGEARDGKEAVRLALELKPDIITMDIVMPHMDGLTAIREILSRTSVPIIVVSEHTTEGAKTTIEALRLGAVDFVAKGSEELKFSLSKVSGELISKIRLHAGKKVEAPRRVFKTGGLEEKKELKPVKSPDIIGIGVSTGGPKVLPTLLKHMGNLPVPVLIAQHMPKNFTSSLAEWLSKETQLRVVEGYEGMEVKGSLYIVLPGGKNTVLYREGSRLFMKEEKEVQTLVRPSANLLFKSMLETASYPMAIILTGMGDDGTEGAKEFVKKGFPVLVQEPATCTVCGMPCSAIQAGAYSYIMKVEEMGDFVRSLFTEVQK